MASRPNTTRDPGALSGPLIGISFIGGVAGGLARSKFPYPRPGSDAAQIREYFGQPSRAPWISVAGQALSVVALAAFTRSAARLAGRTGDDARALQAATVTGGGLAAVALGASALCAAALAAPREVGDAEIIALHRRAFLAGGPIHGAGFGALVGALGLAGLRTGELPRSLALTALASAATNVLSLLYLAWEPAAWLIPAGRFSGLLISGIAGVRLAQRPR